MEKARVLIMISTLLIIGSVGTLAILYAKGYRFGFQENQVTISSRGLLVTNSDPSGAQVFIDGELKTATNNTLSLPPKKYLVEIKKEGFIPWQKEIIIEKEIVSQIEAFLVPLAPSLTALTFSGVVTPVISPDFSKIVYIVPPELENGEKAGLWVLETVDLPLGFNRDPRRVTDGDLSKAKMEWSPDGQEILLTKTDDLTYLLDLTEFTPSSLLVNVNSKIETIKAEWLEKQDKRLKSQLSQLPDELEEIFSKKTSKIRFAPDESKVLYEASEEATIPEGIFKSLPGASTQEQQRDIKVGVKYVYDIKEDRNFKVGEKDETFYWLSNSRNLLLPRLDRIIILDYDGTNRQGVFGAGYVFPHAYPTTSTGRVLILTNLGSQEAANLYWLSLK